MNSDDSVTLNMKSEADHSHRKEFNILKDEVFHLNEPHCYINIV